MEKHYGRFVLTMGFLFGSLYAATCCFLEFRIIYRKYVPAPAVLHPFLLFIIGATFGVSLTCLVAPSTFLRSGTGKQFLGFIGIENLLLFRLKCLFLVALFALLTWEICWLVLPDLLENYGLI